MRLPRFEKERVLKSSQRLSSGMEVVIGVKSESTAWDSLAASLSLASAEGRAERGGEFGRCTLGEAPALGDVTLSMSFARPKLKLSTLRVFFRNRLFPADRMLNVFPNPSLLVNEDARVGVGDGRGRDSKGDSAGEIGDTGDCGTERRLRGAGVGSG